MPATDPVVFQYTIFSDKATNRFCLFTGSNLWGILYALKCYYFLSSCSYRLKKWMALYPKYKNT